MQGDAAAHLFAVYTLDLAPGTSYLDLNVPLMGSDFACKGRCL